MLSEAPANDPPQTAARRSRLPAPTSRSEVGSVLRARNARSPGGSAGLLHRHSLSGNRHDRPRLPALRAAARVRRRVRGGTSQVRRRARALLRLHRCADWGRARAAGARQSAARRVGFGMQPVSPLKHLLERVLRDADLSGTHERAPDGFLLAFGHSRRARPISARLNRRRDADDPVFSRASRRAGHGRVRPNRHLHPSVHGRATGHVHSVPSSLRPHAPTRLKSCTLERIHASEITAAVVVIMAGIRSVRASGASARFQQSLSAVAPTVRPWRSCMRRVQDATGGKRIARRPQYGSRSTVEYSQHLLLARGAEDSDYRITLGRVAGRLLIISIVEPDRALSAPSAGAAADFTSRRRGAVRIE